MAVVVDRLRAMNAEALREAGIEGRAARLGSFCVAGADFPPDVTALVRAFGAAGVADRVLVRNDAHAALRAGPREAGAWS